MPQPIPAPPTPTIAKPPASRCWTALKLAGLVAFATAPDCKAEQRAMPRPEPLSSNYIATAPSLVVTPMDAVIARYEEQVRSSRRTIIGLVCGLAGMTAAAAAAFRAGHKYCLRREELLSSDKRAGLLNALTRNRSAAACFEVRPAAQHLQAVLPTFAEPEDQYTAYRKLMTFQGKISVTPVTDLPPDTSLPAAARSGFCLLLRSVESTELGHILERIWVGGDGRVRTLESVHDRTGNVFTSKQYAPDPNRIGGRWDANELLIAVLMKIERDHTSVSRGLPRISTPEHN